MLSGEPISFAYCTLLNTTTHIHRQVAISNKKYSSPLPSFFTVMKAPSSRLQCINYNWLQNVQILAHSFGNSLIRHFKSLITPFNNIDLKCNDSATRNWITDYGYCMYLATCRVDFTIPWSFLQVTGSTCHFILLTKLTWPQRAKTIFFRSPVYLDLCNVDCLS